MTIHQSGPNGCRKNCRCFKEEAMNREAAINLNDADLFNSLIVDPIADMIRRAFERGYTLKEIHYGLEMAEMHAQEELREARP